MPFRLHIGDIVMSMLEESAFRQERGDNSPPLDFAHKKWTLANGDPVPGSAYAALTKNAALPDLRGRYPRGKDQGTGRIPEGDRPTGTWFDDTFKDHKHLRPNGDQFADAGDSMHAFRFDDGRTAETSGATAGAGSETRPKTTIVNFFVKIND